MDENKHVESVSASSSDYFCVYRSCAALRGGCAGNLLEITYREVPRVSLHEAEECWAKLAGMQQQVLAEPAANGLSADSWFPHCREEEASNLPRSTEGLLKKWGLFWSVEKGLQNLLFYEVFVFSQFPMSRSIISIESKLYK